jgi:hypothetical protein
MYTGGCTCKNIRYRMTRQPVIVHCCHCRWCQRETGASFALNAVVEAEHVIVESPALPEMILTPSQSGKGQKIWRCPLCKIAVWSNYAGGGDAFHFVRVGTLDEPDQLPPDVHIYTMSKQPWVTLPESARVFNEFYNPKEIWSEDGLARWAAARDRQA